VKLKGKTNDFMPTKTITKVFNEFSIWVLALCPKLCYMLGTLLNKITYERRKITVKQLP